MVLKTYGIFDSIQGEYIRTFTAQNDDDAKRAAKYVVRDNGFDDIAGNDRSIHYLYSMNTEDGSITDNNVHLICNLASYIQERKNEALEKSMTEKLANDEFVRQVKDELLLYLKGELKDVYSKCGNNGESN